LAISPIPGEFGQGWPGLVYLSTLAFLPPAAQQRAGLGPRTQEQFTELLPFHEVAHQWWGNTVASRSYHDQWIQEALANYLSLLYADSKRPSEKVLITWLERFRKDLTTKEPGKDEGPEAAGPLTLGTRLRSSKSPRAYEKIVYGKGSWVFHMLRMMLRDPATKNSEAAFAQLLRSLVENFRYRSLSNEDLERAVESAMTKAMDLEGNGKMEWFFDQWVRGTGIPQYSVTFEARPHANAFLVRGKLKQSGVPETFVARVPLHVPGAGGKTVLLGTVATSGRETSFQFVSRIRPRRILIDPELTLLCQTD
jgi:aminopeptidase N